ncbi:AsnC-like helix-turn-helix protein [Motilibacter rhizosphaerae]|uniref:AsnC-like helix-turn-helix protein n=1 Tax=Motilibacter rhizosphaerae TaxID=598652 RepID=A0A4Q7NPB2_9ACTN|nr:Lrp/AsnC ligand binding domain-containing protein [Motilibacter rhizosphaerae]RZS87013.1 AsnC-like helix-turn-helix protein [Motilibacter rhizosphaerae]
MVHAYILVQTEVGASAAVATAAAAVPGVASAEAVIGPYDVVVRASAPTLDELGTAVITPVQSIEGVTRTLTCSVVAL